MAADRTPRLPRRAFLLGGLAVLAAACSDAATSPPGPTSEQPGPAGSSPKLVLPAQATTPAGGSAPITSVAMIGDSITARSKPALTTVFAAKGIGDVVIDAEVSRRIEVGNGKDAPLNGEQALTNLLKIGVDPDVWVFALGTNDVNNVDAGGYAALIDAMLAMPPVNTPVVWVDVYFPAALTQTKLFNTVLRDETAKRAHTTVASWFAIASDKSKKLLSSDDLHPNTAGEAAFAALVGSAVSAVG
jgi:lysophospholipase L1-like esterase